MLLQRLHTSYGLGGNVITWFASYLTGRTQYIRTAAFQLVSLAVLFGVPQGSVLGMQSDCCQHDAMGTSYGSVSVCNMLVFCHNGWMDQSGCVRIPPKETFS